MSRRRNFARSLTAAVLLAAATALLFLLSSPAPGHAQSTERLLLSNSGGAEVSRVNVNTNGAVSQSFKTGKNSTGYTLTKVQIKGRDTRVSPTVPSIASITVTLRADSSGDPAGSALATFSKPGSWSLNSLNTFTLATAQDLEAETTYHIHIAATETTYVQETNRSRVDSGGASNWSFPARYRYSLSGWTEASLDHALAMNLHGTIKALPPDAPTNLGFITYDGQVTLTWTEPPDNGTTITNYRHRYKASSATEWNEWVTVSATTRSATITGLTHGTYYDFELQAQNSVGWSASAAVSAQVGILVSNLGVGGDVSYNSGSMRAQSFTTGSQSGGYAHQRRHWLR